MRDGIVEKILIKKLAKEKEQKKMSIKSGRKKPKDDEIWKENDPKQKNNCS